METVKKTAFFLAVATLVSGQSEDTGFKSMWSGWAEWGACSMTCGRGVTVRHRECVGLVGHRMIRLDVSKCPGWEKEYIVCKHHDCPAGTEATNTRVEQCAEKNEEEVFGRKFEWLPYEQVPNSCELTCMAKGGTFYYNFGPVRDGTSCSGNNVCVNGFCTSVGCDGKVSSTAELDNCRDCGGRDINCTLYINVFKDEEPASGNFGYTDIAVIPAGATYLDIQDVSENFLALSDSRDTYIFNGHWIIDYPGKFEAAGTTIYYNRTRDNNESITAEGPTTENLHLKMIFRNKNTNGITYQYYIHKDRAPRDNLHTPQGDDTFVDEALQQLYDSIQPRHDSRPNEENKQAAPSKQKTTYDVIYGPGYDPYTGLNTGSDEHGTGHHNHHGHGHGHGHDGGGDPSRDQGQGHGNHGNSQPGHDLSHTLLDPNSGQVQSTEAKNNAISGHGVGRGEGETVSADTSLRKPEESHGDGGALVQETATQAIDTETARQTSPKASKKPKKKRNKGRSKSNKHTQAAPSIPGCPPCKKATDRGKQFCTSQFAIHGKILDYEYFGNETRYDVRVIDKYKDDVSLLDREYIWVTNRCRCPRMRINKAYVMVGKLVDNDERRELRLQLDEKSFVRGFNKSNQVRMNTLAKKLDCTKY